MLLKYSQYQRRSKLGANGKPHRGSVTGSRIPNKGKSCRKGKIASSKRLNGLKNYITKREEEVNLVMTVDPTCDNSNDSGLGFDQVDQPYHPHTTSFNNHVTYWSEETRSVKRPRVDIKLESDNANDNFTFPQVITVQQQPQRIFVDKIRKAEVTKGKISGGKISSSKISSGKIAGKTRSIGKRGINEANCTIARSRDGVVCLEILSQPETQHRARYQTEGSRGAVKDTSGNSFPLVKLSGYGGSEPAVLQVYIGTDQGKVAPHMFYQACKVSGKNSTPCVEKKLDGTVVIEIEFEPSKDNLILCDCVGILKERNVDVEHRFPEEATARSRKKSTRCRMVFKSTITLPSGQTETLQVTSHPIACTQPPGIPEICKKSLCSCPVTGNTELFIIGKNFLKDTKVKFFEGESSSHDYWECIVQPDKEFLHQSHLVCTVPRYRCEDTKEAFNVCVSVVSGGKSSDPVVFSYTPPGTFPSQHMTVIPTSPASPTVPTSSASFFAVAQNIGTTNQAILQVSDRSSLLSPQKILIIPSSMDLNASSVSPTAMSPDRKDILKTEDVWIEEKIGVVQGISQASNLLPPPSLVQNPSMDLVPTPNLVQTPGLAQPGLDLVQATNLVQAPSLTQPSTLGQSSSSQDNVELLGVSNMSGMVANSSSSSPPTLLQDPGVSQQPNLIGVSQPPSLLQVSEMVHSSGVLQSPPTSSVLHASPRVLHSPELSPVAATSPVLQNSPLNQSPSTLQTNLSVSPVMDSLNQTSSLVHNIVSGNSIVQTQNITGSDLIASSPPQNISGASGIVPSLGGHPHIISPSIDSPPSIVQNSLVKSPPVVLSPNLVHSQSPPSELTSSSPIIQSSSIIDSSNLNAANLLSDNSLSNTATIIPVTTITEATGIIQNTGLIETSCMAANNNLVTSANIISPQITTSLTSTNIVENSNLLRDSNCCISFARGLESATPGGAANAVADLNSGQVPSMATIEKFVTCTPLPSLSVETYLTHIENKPKVSNLINAFPPTTSSKTPPLAIRQIVAAALESKTTDRPMSFPGNNLANINSEVIHQNSVLLTPSENATQPLNFQNTEFLQTQQTNFQLLPRPERSAQTFATQQYPSTQIFPPPPPPPPLYQEPTPAQEKPKPAPSAPNNKKCEDGIPVPHELTAMSENDLISYINPSCFDQV